MRIRKAMNDDSALLSGIVEADESYIGSKPRGKNNPRGGTGTRGRGTKKLPVLGAVERGGKGLHRRVSRATYHSYVETLIPAPC